jgi:hypothetical protein
MPLYVIQVQCDHCSSTHPTGIVLKLDDGPVAEQTIAAFCGDQPVPKELSLRNETFRCPITGEEFRAKSDEQFLIVF